MSELKQSQYQLAGAPMRCFLPACQKAFGSTCYRGDDDRYYCSAECAEKAEDLDLSHVETFSKDRESVSA